MDLCGKICEEREENEVGRRKGRADLKMRWGGGRGEEKRRKGGGGGCSQKVKVQLGLAVAHGGGLRHHYILAVAHSQALRHGYVGKISRQNGVAGTHTYPWCTEMQCPMALWGKVGAKKVHRVPHLSVA